ncbi:Crp/Fnr family transcriptional regulator [Dysgonomonas sp. ZJ279]|uniref:Crp/Fnr family transcriptional regulator n=1 Tax=Dysgonomonas sp. ZJ279 TaxID=2709796 RepID=UPI0013ECE68E|nr:cyclic nucleotide-binding domain-containing protein [Dysgonomonas sp. ZJ279]
MDKTAKVVNCINSIISLTSDELSLFLSYINTKVLKKNDYLLKEDQVSDFIAFVNSGVLIYTKTLDNADEVTTDFAFDEEWVTNNPSRLKKSPSILNIKAIEESELFYGRCTFYQKNEIVFSFFEYSL